MVRLPAVLKICPWYSTSILTLLELLRHLMCEPINFMWKRNDSWVMLFCFIAEYLKMKNLKRAGASKLKNEFLSFWIIKFAWKMAYCLISIRFYTMVWLELIIWNLDLVPSSSNFWWFLFPPMVTFKLLSPKCTLQKSWW